MRRQNAARCRSLAPVLTGRVDGSFWISLPPPSQRRTRRLWWDARAAGDLRRACRGFSRRATPTLSKTTRAGVAGVFPAFLPLQPPNLHLCVSQACCRHARTWPCSLQCGSVHAPALCTHAARRSPGSLGGRIAPILDGSVGGSVCSASPLRGEGSESVAWLDGRGIGEPYAMANATPGRERERERELFLGNGETHLGTHSHMWSGCLAGWRRSCPSSEQQYAQHKVRRGGVLGDHLGWLLSAARWSLRNVGLG